MLGLLTRSLTCKDTIKFAVFLSDEIFSGPQPILITIEPKSTAILSIELASKRDASSWKEHYLALERNGYFCLYLVSDKAKGLISGFNDACPQTERQSDNYHELSDITHPLFALEKACPEQSRRKAYAAIEEEYRREKVLDSARSDKVINKRIGQYEMARQKTKIYTDLYDQYSYLCGCLKGIFRPFDAKGKLKPLSYRYDEIEVIPESSSGQALN